MNRFDFVLSTPVLAGAFCAAMAGCANVSEADLATGNKVEETPPPHEVVLCRVTGGGRILAGDSPDSFGGNAQPFRSGVDGEWNHLTHEGEHFHGDPDFIECFNVEGPPAAPPSAPANAIFFSGTGTFEGEDGCDFAVYIEDHGEPGSREGTPTDYYSIEISCDSGATYEAGNALHDGNLQIHAVPAGHRPR